MQILAAAQAVPVRNVEFFAQVLPEEIGGVDKPMRKGTWQKFVICLFK